MTSRTKKFVWLASAVVLLASGLASARANEAAADPNKSPALCGTLDTPETGIQGDVPLADQESGRADDGYNCGLSLVGELPVSGTVQGYDHCAFLRRSGAIDVVDMSDPATPRDVGDVPLFGGSETFRVVATSDRAVMVSGSGVYDVRDCEHPVLKGQITWPTDLVPLGPSHDIRISHDGTKVFASFGVKWADITNLDDPSTWTVKNPTCDIAAQYHPGMVPFAATGVCPFYPQLSHSPTLNADGTRLYVGGQLRAANSGYVLEDDALRVIDLTVYPPKIIDDVPGPGHGADWFRTADGRQFVLHVNEIAPGTTSCAPYPRPSSLGWAYEGFITEDTGKSLERRSMVQIAINKPENCQAKQASGQNPTTTYNVIDDPVNASFAAMSFGSAGLRVFDIRKPEHPTEVAYFNRGALVHAGVSHYDAARGLLYLPGSDALRVVEIQPQVLDALGLPHPSDGAYPRYPHGGPPRP